MSKDYRICPRCVMDTSDPEIYFDKNGICNHCRQYEQTAGKRLITGQAGQLRLQEIAAEIKEYGKNNKFDCILGLSGGIDSSFVAYQAKRLGLRPLAVHCDNGWDSEAAVRNIENIVRALEMELYTLVIDWEEFKDLQLAFLKASVVDIEMLTDHAILATVLDVAHKNNIRYVLSGTNIATEGVLPEAWIHRKTDLLNLRAIHKKYGKIRLKTFPAMGIFKWRYYRKKMKFIEILNYLDYNRQEAKGALSEKIGWQDYGGKHHESVFTKFYQAYILPSKFGIDKRRAHLSSLICSGQISREEALKELDMPLYDKDELARDKEYVLKKLGLSADEFERLMGLPVRKHRDFPTEDWIYALFSKAKRLLSNLAGKGQGWR